MGWSATRLGNGTFHVVNDTDGSHFVAETEDEIHEVIAAVEQRFADAEQAKQAAEAANDPSAVSVNPGNVSRVN